MKTFPMKDEIGVFRLCAIMTTCWIILQPERKGCREERKDRAAGATEKARSVLGAWSLGRFHATERRTPTARMWEGVRCSPPGR